MANTENLGVNAVDTIISRTDRLDPKFSKNDKELSWDGFIYLFHHAGDNHSKRDSAGRVPVQIKGHRCQNVETERKSYSVDMADLRNYLQDGGIIFFVVYITDEDEYVYYCNLLPHELRRILRDYGDQDSKTIYLKEFPRNKTDVEELVFNFLNDRDKQRAAISSELYTIEDIAKQGMLKGLSFGYVPIGKKYKTPIDYFFDHGMYLYANLPLGILLPIEHVDHIEVASTELTRNVYVNGKLYYSKYTVLYKKDRSEVHFGKCLQLINFNEGNAGKLNIKIQGTLKERINDLEFMIEALLHKGITIDNQELQIFNISEDELKQFNIPERRETLEYLKKVQHTLDVLHVKKDLDCDSLTKQDEYNLALLVSAIADKNLISLKDTGSPFGKYKVANLNLYVCAIKDDDSELFRMYDILDAPLVFRGVDEHEKEFDSCICIKFESDTLLNYDNIDYDVIVENLGKIIPSEQYSQHLTLFLLEILKVYDELKLPQHPLLQLAKKVVALIKDRYTFNDPEITTLNCLQIVRREREFSEEEIADIQAIITDPANENKYIVLTGAYILLDKQDDARRSYLKMSENEKQAFDEYPINRFRNWR